MRKSWCIIGLAMAACNGHSIGGSVPATGRAELHVAPAFAPIRATKIDPIATAQAFVNAERAVLGVDGHAAFNVLHEEITADGNDHVRLQQVYDGVKVWGSDIVVHSDGENVTGVDGTLLGALDGLDLAPSVADTTAMTIAKNDYVSSARSPSAVRWSREASELVVLPVDGGSARLAWHVVFATDGAAGTAGIWNYFVDAHDGSVVQMFNNLQSAVVEASGPGGNTRVTRTWNMNLDVTQSGANYIMNTPQFQTTNAKTGTDYTGTSLTNYNSADKAANDGHGFAEITIKMLKDWQGYNSIDNKGLILVSNIHAGAQLGTQDNAAWDGSSMNYGDGDGTQFFNFTGALDVIAHEIDHGFTQYHANLQYSGQSGGMNESFSDIAGTTAKFYYDAKSADFNLGGDIFVKANTYIRYMCKPSMDGMSIDNASQYKTSLDVHYSSGVMNRAFCRAAKRLSAPIPTPARRRSTASEGVEGVVRGQRQPLDFVDAVDGRLPGRRRRGDGAQVFGGRHLGARQFVEGRWRHVQLHHVNDFGLSMTPATATVMAGNAATFMVATTVGAGNTAQSLTLSATGLPSGVTATFNPATIMSGATSTLTIQTAYNTPVGDIMFDAVATGATPHMAAGTLTVTAPPPDLTPPPPDDMATGNGGNGGSGGSGGGSGDHGGASGCTMSGASSSSPGAFALLALAALALFLSRRRRPHA